MIATNGVYDEQSQNINFNTVKNSKFSYFTTHYTNLFSTILLKKKYISHSSKEQNKINSFSYF